MKNYCSIIITILLFSFNVNAQIFQWAKSIDTKDAYSLYSSKIKLDAQNNIIVAGLFRDIIDFDLGAGVFNLVPSGGPNLDIFIAKYNSNGNFIWAKQIKGHDWTQLWDFTVDKSNNIIISAYTNDIVDVNPSNTVNNVGTLGIRTSFLAKYSSSGNFVWVKTFSENGIFSKIATDSQGKVVASGHFYYTVDFDPAAAVYNLTATGNSSHLFILKLNSTGTFSWVKRMGDSTNFAENVYDIHLDSLNNIFIAGRFNGKIDMDPSTNKAFLDSQGKYVGFYAKYSSTGSYKLAKSFNCSGNSMVNNIRTDSKGNVILTGKFIGTLDLDASAAVLNVTASSAYDIFVTKYNVGGNMKWGFDFGNASEEILTNHEVSPKGSTYIFGRFKGTVDFNPSTAVANLISAPVSQPDLYFVSYDSTGTLINSQKIGNNKTENPTSFTLNKNGELCLFGNFAGTLDFDFASANTSNLTATDQDFFIAKYNFSNFRNANEEEIATIDIPSIEKEASVVIFPNPVVTQLQIKIAVGINLENIKVYNLQGVCVIDTNLNKIDNNSSPYSLDVSQLTSGFYVIKINNQINKTFIKN